MTPYFISDLKLDEAPCGVAVLMPYPDPRSGGDPWTVGWGHTGRDVVRGVAWTPAMCERALAADVGAVAVALDRALPWWRDQSDPRQDVLCNMGFNLGIHGLLEFKITLHNIQDGDYAQAAVGMLQSDWAEQVGSRAKRLAKQMESGIR